VPSKTLWYLFNGDFVDRGLHGVEVICTLLAYSLLYPQFVFLNRGNHEALVLNQVFGFADEVSKKYDADQFPALFGLFEAVFNRLPLCTLIQDSVFVVHGGLPVEPNVTLNDIEAIDHLREIPTNRLDGLDDQIFSQLMWNDPQPRDGFEVMHDGLVLSVFSASSYCGFQANKGAYVVLTDELKPYVVQFHSQALQKFTLKELIGKKHTELQGYFSALPPKVSRLQWKQGNSIRLNEPNVTKAFEYFDRSRKGRISYDDVKATLRVLGLMKPEMALSASPPLPSGLFAGGRQPAAAFVSEQMAFELMHQWDCNQDGIVDMQEFQFAFAKQIHATTSTTT
ncbi:hypothetical protein DYB28_005260, partial [Aphanomyces astaci]